MTTAAIQSPACPLRFLANVVASIECATCSPSSDLSPLSSPSSTRSLSTAPTSISLHDVAGLHIACKTPEVPRETRQKTLNYSTNMPLPDPTFVPFIRHTSGRRTRKTSDQHLKSRMKMKTRRTELFEKAKKIKSLDNSPVNERQLLVLRMVYDEITMYPCESWMVLIAIIINRAYKQVRNWFSNERQKNRAGESILFNTEDGDRVRLRTRALSACQNWSDSFFEEVIMIYNYRVQRNSRFRASLRGPHDASPDYYH